MSLPAPASVRSSRAIKVAGSQPAGRSAQRERGPRASLVRILRSVGNRRLPRVLDRGRLPGSSAALSHAPSLVHHALRALGEPLDASTRALLEPHFHADFSAVRIHRDPLAAASATSVGALAYTVGQHVVFGAGRYAPGSPSGRRLLAHELTHVVQQARAPHSARLQRFTTREHEDIGDAAFALAEREFGGAGFRGSPLWTLLRDGSRYRMGERVRAYGNIVADPDFFETFEGMIRARGERPQGFWEDVDVGRLALRNLEHFAPHGIRRWLQDHDFAVTQMRFAHDQLAWAQGLLRRIDPLLEGARRAILAGQDDRAQLLLSRYRAEFERIRPRVERVIPAARALATEALQRNAFADHFLTDAFSAGHIVTPREEILHEAHVDIRGPVPSRATTVRAALVPTWSEFWEVRAQARSLAWHDLDNYYGIEVDVRAPGFAPWQACGDRCSDDATRRRHWDATRASAILAEEQSIKHLWIAGLTGAAPDYRTVLDLVPRPTWRNYPGWGTREWENQLRYIRGERVPAVPGQQLPDPVAVNLLPIEHCGPDLELGCWRPFMLTERDWVRQYSFARWVKPWIGRVKAMAADRYKF